MLRGAAILVASFLFACVMWFFVQSVFIPHQLKEAATTNRPRGLLSDLYPRWYGARELLLHHRNPYGQDITQEIERGYYGRELNSALPGDPKDKQAFAYPVFVVFFLAPTVSQPFERVQRLFFWILLGFTVLSVPLWLSAARMRVTLLDMAAIIILLLGSFQFIQGIKLQQLTLLVAPLLAVAITLLARGRLLTAGAILSIAFIKPQLSLPLGGWLMLWAVGDFKRRWRLIAGLLLVATLLLGGSEVVLPGWIAKFYGAVIDYRQYTGGQSIPVLFFGKSLGWPLEAILVGYCIALGWLHRSCDLESQEFRNTTALVLAVTVVIVPMVALYNQILLLLPIFVIWGKRATLWKARKSSRMLFVLTFAWAAWPWMAATLVVIAKNFVLQTTLPNAWSLPLSSMLGFPLLITLMILLNWRRLNDVSPEAIPEQ